MGNFDTAVAATNTALNSQGSAAKENSRYMDSFQGKLSNLKSAFQAFATKVLNSDAMKKGLDLLTSAFSKLSDDSVSGKIAQTLTKFTLLGGLLAGGIGKYAPVMSSLVSTFTNFGNILGKTTPAATKTAQAVTKMGTAAAKTATTVSKTTTTLTTLGNVGYVAGSAATGFEALASSSAKGATTTATFTKNMAGVSKEASKTANSVSKVTSTVTTLGNVGYVTGGISDGFNSVTKSASESSTMTATFAKNMKGASKEAKTATKAAKTATKATGEIAKTASKATRATEGLAAGFTAVGASAGPIAAIILGIVAAIAAIAAINNAANPLTQLNKQADSLESNIDSVKQRIAELESSGGNPVFIQTWKNRLKEFEDQLEQTQELIKRTEITGSPSPEVPTTGGATGGTHGKYEGSTANTLPQQYKDLGQNIQLAQSRRRMIDEMDRGTRSIEEYVSASADLAKAEEYIYGVRDALQEAIDAGYEFTPSMQTIYKAILDYDPSLTLQSAGQKSVAMQASIAAQTKSIVSTVGDAFTKMKNGSLDTIDDIANIGIAWENAGMTTTATLDTMINKLQAGTLTQEEYNTSMSQLVKEVMLNNMSNEQFASMSEETIATLLKQVGVTDATAQAQKLLGEAYQESKDKIIAQEKALEQVDGIYRGIGSTLMETSNFATGFGKELQEASLKGDKAAKSFIQTIQGISEGKIDYIDLDDESISSWVDKLRVAATNGDAYAQQIVDAIDTINAAKIDGDFGNGDGVVNFMEKLKFEAAKGKEGAKEYLSTIEEIQKGKYIDITGPNFEPLYNDLKKARDEGDETAKEFLDWYESFSDRDIELGFKINSEAAWDEQRRQQAELAKKEGGTMSQMIASSLESGVDSGAVDNAWQKLTQPSDPAKIRQAAEDTANEAVDAWTKAKNILKKLFIGGEGDEGKINTWSELAEGSKKAGDSAKAAGEKAAEGSAGFMQVGDSAKEASSNIVSGVDLMTGKATAVGAVGDNMTKTAEATSEAANSLVEDGQRVVDTVDKIGQSAEGTDANTQSIDSLSKAYGLAADNAMTSAEKFEQAAQKIQDSLNVDTGTTLDDLNAKLETLSGGLETYAGIFEGLGQMISDFGSQVGKAGDDFSHLAEGINDMQTKTGSAKNEISNLVTSAGQDFATLDQSVHDATSSMQNVVDMVGDMSFATEGMAKNIDSAMQSASDSATDATTIFANLKSQSAPTVDSFQSMKQMAEKLKDAVNDLETAAKDANAELSNVVKGGDASIDGFSGSLSGLNLEISKVDTLCGQAKDSLQNLLDAASDLDQKMGDAADSVKEAFDNVSEGTTTTESQFANFRGQFTPVSDMIDTFGDRLGELKGKFEEFGGAFDGIGSDIQSIAQAFSNLSSDMIVVTGALLGFQLSISNAATTAEELKTSLSDISTSATTVDTSLSSIATSASDAMSGITDGAHNAASALITLTTQSSQSVTHMNSLGTASGNAGTALGTFAANVTTATASLSNAASSMLTIAGSMNSVSMAASQASVNISSIASNLSSAAGSGALLSTSLSIVSGAASSASAGVASLATSASSCGATLSKISSSASKASSAVGKVAGPANRTSSALRKVATAANSASAALRSFATSARSVGNLTLNVNGLTSSLTAIVGKANAAAAALRNLKASASGAASAGSGALSNAQYIDTIHGMATGGTVTKEGTILVGEEGPEIVKLPSGAEVYNNDTTRQLLSKLSTSEKTHWGDFDKNRQPELPKVNNAYADWTKTVTKQYETAKGSYYDLKKSDLEKQAKEISKKIGSGAGLAQAVIDAQNKRTEDFTKQLEEQNKLYSEQIDIMEHRLFLMQKNGATEEEQIAQIRAMQAELHKQAEYYRKLGINENDTIIREIQSSWWSLEGDAQDLFQSIADAATEAAEKAKEEWQNYYEELEEGLQNKTEKYELLFEQVAKDAQRRIDDLNEEKDYWEDYYDEKIKALEEENDKIEDNIKLQELQDELAKARQKKVYVYKDGRFQYADDIDEISEAQKNLESYEREKALEDEKDRLEKLKDEAVKNIEEQINKWEEYKNEWENVVDDYQEEQNRLIIEQEFGINSEKMNWDTRIRNLSNFVSEYKEYMRQLKDAQNMQERIDKGEIFGAGTYEAGKDGKAPKGLKIGDKVVTDGGTFQIIKVNEDGTYESKKISSETRKEYASRGGTYDKASSATETPKTESSGRTYQVGKNGNAPSGLKVGDNVVTAGGTYRITKVKNDGTYESELVNNITNKDYEGTGARYDPAPSDVSWSESKGTTVSVGNDGKAPRGLKVGDRVATAGGTYKITKVKSDGTYESELIEKPISQPGQSPGGSQTKRYTGYNSSGGAYNITSQKGIDFIENAKAYATLTGGDGSYWTKNNDGSVTVNQNGNIYTVAGVGKYEKGTEKNTNPGLSLLGEKGPELGILGSGDGVIPNDLTRNLFAWGALTPDSVLKSLVNNTQSGISMNGVQMSFPNVKNGNDAEDFVKAVINIANQRAYKRR